MDRGRLAFRGLVGDELASEFSSDRRLGNNSAILNYQLQAERLPCLQALLPGRFSLLCDLCRIWAVSFVKSILGVEEQASYSLWTVRPCLVCESACVVSFY